MSAQEKDGIIHEIRYLVHPDLLLLGKAIPPYFYESLSPGELENRLVGGASSWKRAIPSRSPLRIC